MQQRNESADELRPLLVMNAYNWHFKGQTLVGWVDWIAQVKNSEATSPLGRAAKVCYGDVGGIGMLVWGPT